MALIKNANGGRISFVKMVTGKKGKDPYLVQRTKGEGGWEDGEAYYAVEGYLKKAEVISRETEKWGIINTLSVTLIEPMEDDTLIECPVNGATQGFLNSLCAAPKGEKVRIQPGYRKDWITGDLWKTVWFTGEDGKMIPWAFSISDLPEVKKVEIKGSVIVDDTDRVNFFKAALDKHWGSPAATEPEAEPEAATPDDDLPF